MVVPLLRLTDETGTVILDMTNYGATVSVSGSNPLIIIEPPAGDPSATAVENFNAVVVNLAMFAPRINITFVDSGTHGTESGFGDDPFNGTALHTHFQKVFYFFQALKTRKRLYINDPSNYVLVQMSGFRATNVSGQKNIMNFSIDLVIVGEEST